MIVLNGTVPAVIVMELKLPVELLIVTELMVPPEIVTDPFVKFLICVAEILTDEEL